MAARMGKITGSRLKDIIVKRGTEKKIGFFEVIAERVSTDPYGMAMNETPMERGTRLEPEAIDEFEKATELKVDRTLVLWVREENEGIAISPDGFIGTTVAVESKCLSSARHLEAYIKHFFWKRSVWDSVPSEYREQALQYFVVNDLLGTLHMVFYDPRITVMPYFKLTITRDMVAEEVLEALEYQRKEIKELDEIVNSLTKF